MTGVHLVPAQHLDLNILRRLADDLATLFPGPVDIVRNALNLSPFYSDDRGQYNSTRILLHMKERFHAVPYSAGIHHCYLAVCEEDLFTPILTFVFGEAEFKGQVAIISCHRLRPERYGLAPDPGHLAERLLKEAVHELCHCFGLVHCRHQWCVMRSSSDAEQIDLKRATLCDGCRATLSKTGMNLHPTS